MIEVGRKVVCINNTPTDNRPEAVLALSKLKVDEIYTVREIFGNGEAIGLEEIESPFSERLGREIGYKINRFRPLDSYQWADEVMNKISEEIEDEFFVRVTEKF